MKSHTPYSSLPQRHLHTANAVLSVPGHTLMSQYIHVNVFQCCARSHAVMALALLRQDEAMGMKVQLS